MGDQIRYCLYGVLRHLLWGAKCHTHTRCCSTSPRLGPQDVLSVCIRKPHGLNDSATVTVAGDVDVAVLVRIPISRGLVLVGCPASCVVRLDLLPRPLPGETKLRWRSFWSVR